MGQNLIITVNEVQLSKKIEDKTQREEVKAMIADYNAKNSATLEKNIIKVFKQQEIKNKEAVKKVAKVSEKVSKAKSATSAKKGSKKELALSDIEKPKKLAKEKVKELAAKMANHKPKEIPKENKPVTRRGEH